MQVGGSLCAYRVDTGALYAHVLLRVRVAQIMRAAMSDSCSALCRNNTEGLNNQLLAQLFIPRQVPHATWCAGDQLACALAPSRAPTAKYCVVLAIWQASASVAYTPTPACAGLLGD